MNRTLSLGALLLAMVQTSAPPRTLPALAVEQLKAGLAASRRHEAHVWRDQTPLDAAGRLHGFIEIAKGDRRKFEFDIAANRMRLDRTIPRSLGGYPVNYGFVPQTISYDGDPFDVLVLGPPLPTGTRTAGVIVAVMEMEDEKGLDSKVVISPVDAKGRPLYSVTAADRERMSTFFNTYKRHEPGKFSRVAGWGSRDEGLAFVRVTHDFFLHCRETRGACVRDQ